MCIRIIYHSMVCDVRPRSVLPSDPNSQLINPYAEPERCHEHCIRAPADIPPRFRCEFGHVCCRMTARYIRCPHHHNSESSSSSGGPGCTQVQNYHMYTQCPRALADLRRQQDLDRDGHAAALRAVLAGGLEYPEVSEWVDYDDDDGIWPELPYVDAHIQDPRVMHVTTTLTSNTNAFVSLRNNLLKVAHDLYEEVEVIKEIRSEMDYDQKHLQSLEHTLCAKFANDWGVFEHVYADGHLSHCEVEMDLQDLETVRKSHEDVLSGIKEDFKRLRARLATMEESNLGSITGIDNFFPDDVDTAQDVPIMLDVASTTGCYCVRLSKRVTTEHGIIEMDAQFLIGDMVNDADDELGGGGGGDDDSDNITNSEDSSEDRDSEDDDDSETGWWSENAVEFEEDEDHHHHHQSG
ncbi:hypothetical protein QBC46DRAFT_339369 [Diplogelasinospora grovesii]|uniref:Uncharacterized protein n=1 Tax=Diplogelasinospora grovesii TaxID=303347 RepID=A0AAN6NED3_9PEZI|nr:hypothetical protein QBC46DRAFT_339369 [Diplogelasinospora grovesii]